MTKKAATISLHGNDYAKVAERLKIFREAKPNGKTISISRILEDKSTEFVTYLWNDRSDAVYHEGKLVLESADANGSATKMIDTADKDGKQREKLETVSLGRCLANAGYLASGEIASSEEMEDFLQYQQEKTDNIIAEINAIKTEADLKKLWASLQAKGTIANPDVFKAKEAKKKELANANN